MRSALDNVRKIRPGRRERLQAEIILLERRQVARYDHIAEIQLVIDRKQRVIDNLRAQLEACDEQE